VMARDILPMFCATFSALAGGGVEDSDARRSAFSLRDACVKRII